MDATNSLTVLLVEDSPDDVFFFQRAIKKCGVQARTKVVIDGVEAIDYLKGAGQFSDRATHPLPDVIFLDLKLPHVNGFEVLEWIRTQSGRLVAPVTILTSSNEPEDRDRCVSLGASLYLTKPPSPEQLREILGKAQSGNG